MRTREPYLSKPFGLPSESKKNGSSTLPSTSDVDDVVKFSNPIQIPSAEGRPAVSLILPEPLCAIGPLVGALGARVGKQGSLMANFRQP